MDIPRSCCLCFNRPSIPISTGTLSISSSQIVSSCQMYLSTEIVQTVSWTDVMSDGPIIFCDQCLLSVSQLSVLHDRLNHIENDIKQLATKINLDVEDQRSLHQNNEVRIVTTSEIPENNFHSTVIPLVETVQTDLIEISFHLEENYDEGNSLDNIEDSSSHPESSHFTININKSDKLENYDDGNPLENVDDNCSHPESPHFTTEISKSDKTEIYSDANSLDNVEDSLSHPDSSNFTANTNKSDKSDGNQSITCDDMLPHMKEGVNGFKCEKCSKTFARLTILKSHDCDKVTYDCETCGFSFSGPSVLRLHQTRTHGGEKPFKCSICAKSFGFKHHLVGHMRTHTGEKPFECDFCGKKYSDQSHMIKHRRKHDNIKHLCTKCDKSFADQRTLKEHLRFHMISGELKCEICNQTFTAIRSFKRHQLVHKNGKQFVCEQCGKSFKFAISLKTHETTHTTEQNVSCEVCSKVISCARKLKTHMTNIHPQNQEILICDTCGKVSTNVPQHKNHMKIHTGGVHECKMCDRKYKLKAKLALHIKTEHQGEIPYKCEYCEESFKNHLVLQRHKIKKHPEIINESNFHTCGVCKKPFPSPKFLKDHQVISHHVTGGGFVECTVCSLKFANMGIYEWHKIKRSSTLRRSECKHCENDGDLILATYCDFFSHMQSFHGESVQERYTCKGCEFIVPLYAIKTHDCLQPVDPLYIKPNTRKRLQTMTSKSISKKKKSISKPRSNEKVVKQYGKGKKLVSEENEYSSGEENWKLIKAEDEDKNIEIKEEVESSCDSVDSSFADIHVKMEVESDSQ